MNTKQNADASGLVMTKSENTASDILEVFLNNSKDSFILADIGLNIIYFNKPANELCMQLLGTGLYKGMPLLEAATTEKKETLSEIFRQAFSGREIEKDHKLQLADGSFICYHSRYQPAKNKKGEIAGVLITATDVSEQKKKEEDLKISNERYHLISLATSDVTWDYDLLKNDVYWTESFTRFFGHEYSDNTNGYELWEKYIHAEDKKRVVTKLNAAIENGDAHWSDEYRFVKEDGNVVYVYDRGMIIRNADGVPVRIIGAMQDITQKKQAENKIALSEHRLRSLIQTGNDLIGILNTEGNYIYVSPTFKQLGYNAEFLAGKNVFSFIHPDDVPVFLASFHTLATQKEVAPPLFRFKNAAGEWRWIETTATNLVDDPAVQGIVVNSNDITERKLKDEALQKALNDLNKVLDSSVDVIVVTDEHDRYLRVSAASSVVWGYTPEELIGRSCTELIHPADREKTSKATAEVMAGARLTNFQNRYIRKDGSTVPLMWSAIWDATEKVMYATARDASEKEKAEHALKLSEERYRELFENNPVPMFMFDVETLQFVMVNEAALKLYGYSKEAFLTKKITEIRPSEELPRILGYLEHVKDEHCMRYAGEWKHVKKGGTVFDVEVRSHKVIRDGRHCRLAAINDLTQRNEARSALQKSESMFRAISENFPNGIVSILDREMKLVYVAGKELEILGISPESFIGSHYTRHFNDDDGSMIRLAQRVFEGEAIVSEITFLKRNYLLSSVPLHNADGNVNRMLVVAQNITFHKKSQEEKELLIEELTKNINDLKQFSYITSHNLRGPISNLIGIMGLIETDKIQDADTVMLVEKFKESTLLLNDTVNDLLRVLFIKNKINIQKEVLDVDVVWKNVCTSVNNVIEDAGAEITADFTKGSQILFNKSYAESILLNLLTNAIKYRSHKRRLHISLKTKSADGYLVLEFCDNGIGINMQQHRHKIFGLYQRFHNYADSKGLGLYIVHSQITALGGKIEVESTENEGTCFRIYFKIMKEDAEQSTADR